MGRCGQADARRRRRPAARRTDRDEVRRGRLEMVTRTALLRGDVHLVQLDPTRGSEIKKTRPGVIISPDEINDHLRRVIMAAMAAASRSYPWRVACRFQKRSGFVALDQLRTVDTERLVRPLGRLTPQTVTTVLRRLQEMFAE